MHEKTVGTLFGRSLDIDKMITAIIIVIVALCVTSVIGAKYSFCCLCSCACVIYLFIFIY